MKTMKHRLKIWREFISLKVEEEIKYGFNKGKEVIVDTTSGNFHDEGVVQSL